MTTPRLVTTVLLPTAFGEFSARAYETSSGLVYLALVRGEVDGADGVLARVHSECLTGDALGSRRCDCGVQLATALRRIAAADRGVLVYATGHEGRGIGLIGKLLAYAEQDRGLDTVDANLTLGLPADARTYTDAAAVLQALGIRSIRLMTNNPAKVRAIGDSGVTIDAVEPIQTVANPRNVEYLRAKRSRLGHVRPSGPPPEEEPPSAPDVAAIIGDAQALPHRPAVILKYAQTLDGRIATSTGDARWISSEDERSLSHALRAACDAVMVGVGTVLSDDCRLTVRLAPGASPVRVVLDSSLRTPPDAAILAPEAATIIVTTPASPPARRAALREAGIGVEVVPAGAGGVDIPSALAALRRRGIRSVLVEGGARMITSLLAAGVVDRVVVGIAPTILGAGTESVGDLGVTRIAEGVRLSDRSTYVIGDDLLIAADVAEPEDAAGSAGDDAGRVSSGSAGA